MEKNVKVIAKYGLNVREKDTKESGIVRVLECGEVVEYSTKRKGWLKVEDGWIMEQFTEPVENDETVEDDSAEE